jgi:STE24 endopeptidase
VIAPGAAHGEAARSARGAALLLPLVVLGVMLWSRAGIHFRLWTAIRADGSVTRMAFFMACGTVAVVEFFMLPVVFYRGFVLPHRFELSTQTVGAWLQDWAMGTALEAAVVMAFLVLAYRLMTRWRFWWWVPAGLAAALFMTGFAWLGPLVVDPLFNTFTPLADAHLNARIRALAAKAAVPVDEILVMDASTRTKQLNAYYTGLGSTRRIVVYDTLLRACPERQVLSVIAHEQGHWSRGHIVSMLLVNAAGVLLTCLVVALVLSLCCEGRWFGLADPTDPAGIPLVLAVAVACQALGTPVEAALSRSWEREADQAALEWTADPEAFIEVERRIVRTNLLDVRPPAWAVLLYGTHPPTLERIGAALAYARRTSKDSPQDDTTQP